MTRDVTDLTPVICKECVPVFYETGEVPQAKPGTLVLKHVALCPLHSATQELLRLLDLIVMEFRSDPTSVACFDLHAIVEPAKALCAKLEKYR